MKKKRKVSTDQIKSTIRITDYAQELGFTIKPIGRYLTLSEHDSVRIDPQKNCFWRNATGAKGSVIDFALEFTDQSLKDILKQFSKRVKAEPAQHKLSQKITPPKHESADFNLPEKDNNIRNIYAYLVNTRGIEKNLIAEWISSRRLYQDNHKNCVFVSYTDDQKADFASLRGTNTYKRFVADVEGSNYDHCFYIPEKDTTKMIVTESCIDLLSVLSAQPEMQKCYKVALSGSQKYPAIYHHLNENPNIKTLYLAFDNDKAGKEAIESVKNDLKNWHGDIITYLPPQEKDWNAFLTEKKTAINDYCNSLKEDQYSSTIEEEIEE